MKTFRDHSLKTKLTLMIMLASFAALGVACLVFVYNDRTNFKQRLVEDLTMLSSVAASNSASAVSFDDDKSARDVLSSLSANAHIEFATILKEDGKVFASYVRKGVTDSVPSEKEIAGNSYFSGDRVDLVA